MFKIIFIWAHRKRYAKATFDEYICETIILIL